jgi:molybdopterin converting factor small subunit
MAVVRIPTPLRAYTNGQSEVVLPGGTVQTVLDHLLESYPALKPHLLDGQGELRPFVNLFLGEENIQDLQGVQTLVEENDRLVLIPSIAGGRS